MGVCSSNRFISTPHTLNNRFDTGYVLEKANQYYIILTGRKLICRKIAGSKSPNFGTLPSNLIFTIVPEAIF